MVSCDLIGPFYQSEQGNSYALTVIDYITGWVEAVPLRDKKAVPYIMHLPHKYGLDMVYLKS